MNTQFDELTKSLAQSVTRRAALNSGLHRGIVYGQNVRTWSDTESLLGRASEAWSGANDKGDFVRLIKCSWQNPHPEEGVQTIEFIANHADTQPILFAITVEQ